MSDLRDTTRGHAPTSLDAVTMAVVDASASAALITDEALCVLHATAEATELLGVVTGELDDVLTGSRLLQPARVAQTMRDALAGHTTASYHVAESASGEDRCLMLRPARTSKSPTRWVWWFDDVTDLARLQRLQLLAEIGRSHGPSVSWAEFAQHLVDRVCDLLGLDSVVLALGDKDVLQVSAMRGIFLPEGHQLRVANHPFVVKALASQRPQVCDGTEWKQRDGGTHYIVPLTCTPTVLGTLHLAFFDEHDVTNYRAPLVIDTMFLEALAIYAGTAIANTRLYEAARNERRHLQAVVENIPDGVILYNGRGEVLVANEGARQITEREWSNLNSDARAYKLRTPTGELMRRADWPFFRPQRDPTIDVIDEEVVLDFGDRCKHILVSVVRIRATGDTEPSFVGTLRDVSNERIVQQERDSFMHVLSHELRSPLTPLTGFLEMVRQQIEHGEDVDAQLLGRAQRQVGRLSRLLDSVLDLSRLERGLVLNRDTVDLCELVAFAADLWQSDPRGVQIEVKIANTPILADVDSDRLEQVLTNLVDNAIKHSNTGDVVTIELDRRDNEAVLTVSDRGAGIPNDEVQLIFERFFSGASRRGGLGIGLYVTRQIVGAHGGQVTVKSRPGEGTSFCVTLPVVTN